MLTFRDTDKNFELHGDLLKLITNKNYNVDLANLADKKLMYEFAKLLYFVEKVLGNRSTREKSLRKLLKTPAIMASEISTIILPEKPNELCDRLKLYYKRYKLAISLIKLTKKLLLSDKLLENKCISTRQYNFLLL